VGAGEQEVCFGVGGGTVYGFVAGLLMNGQFWFWFSLFASLLIVLVAGMDWLTVAEVFIFWFCCAYFVVNVVIEDPDEPNSLNIFDPLSEQAVLFWGMLAVFFAALGGMAFVG
jgi:hypothetical protein